MIEEAFREVYPGRAFPYETRQRYSSKFNDFNANIRLSGNRLTISLSRSWDGISDEIRVGLIQTLLVRLFKGRFERTVRMDLYELFLKNLHKSVEKTDADPALETSFVRVSGRYFDGFVDRPNLVWGQVSTTKLGTYEFARDLITISSVLKDAPTRLLDYVVYHELLHKKHKFESSGRRMTYHGKRFRDDEARFEHAAQVEEELKAYLRKRRGWRGIAFWRSF